MMSLYSMLCCLLMGLKDLQSKNDVAMISAFRRTAAVVGIAGTKNSSTGWARLFLPESFRTRIIYESTAFGNESAGLGDSKILYSNLSKILRIYRLGLSMRYD